MPKKQVPQIETDPEYQKMFAGLEGFSNFVDTQNGVQTNKNSSPKTTFNRKLKGARSYRNSRDIRSSIGARTDFRQFESMAQFRHPNASIKSLGHSTQAGTAMSHQRFDMDQTTIGTVSPERLRKR